MPAPSVPPVSLYASPWGAWLLLGSAAVTVGTAFVILAAAWGADGFPFVLLGAAGAAAFGGWLGRMGWRLRRLDGPALTLDAGGFEDRRLGTGRVPWSAVRELRRVEEDVEGATQVVLAFRFHDPAAVTAGLRRGTRWRARLSRADLVVDLGGLRGADPDEVAEVALGYWRLGRRAA